MCEYEIPPVTQFEKTDLSLQEHTDCSRAHSERKENKTVQVKIECDTQELDNIIESSELLKSNQSLQNCACDSSNKQEKDLNNKNTSTILPKVTDHRKRKMTKEKKTNVNKKRCKSRERLLEEPTQKETGLDALNLSLPTPKNTRLVQFHVPFFLCNHRFIFFFVVVS